MKNAIVQSSNSWHRSVPENSFARGGMLSVFHPDRRNHAERSLRANL